MDDWLWKRCPHCDGTGEYINPADLRAVWRCPHCNVLHQVRAPDAEAKVRAWDRLMEGLGAGEPVRAADLRKWAAQLSKDGRFRSAGMLHILAEALEEAADD